LQNPDHVYATSAGYPVSYSVSLTANGATTTKANYITLTSSCTSDPVKVGVTPYLSISNAFNTVRSTNDVIQVMAVGQTGTLDWNQNITVELRGGYDCNFTTNSLGFTTVTPSLTISGGTLTIENLIVQ
jgi:PKD repeat protein